MRRPEIRAVRAVYDSLERDIARGRTTSRDSAIGCAVEGNWSATLTVLKDDLGRIRRFTVAGGSDDSFETVAYTFDPAGRLRFALSQRGAVNGSHGEQRVYWDASGQLLYRDNRLLDGEGYPWPDVEPLFHPATINWATCP